MDKKSLEYFKDLLYQEKRDIIDTINRIDGKTYEGSFKESMGEISVYDNHPADIATETFTEEQNLNFKNNEIFILKHIEEALDKIENGDYGVCNKCGREISIERLKMIPYTKHCVECHQNLNESNDRDVVDRQKAINPKSRLADDLGIYDDKEIDYMETIDSISKENYDKRLYD